MEEEGPVYGRLNIVGKDGKSDLAFPIDKKDPSCDIRIINKEISRKHAEVFVDDDTGVVFIMSMGREPVRVNGEPVTSPRELLTGDHIEVVLEGRTREFVFEGDDDTVEVPQARQPLGQVSTNSAPGAAFVGKKPGAPPPPPPPPPPPYRARPPGAAPPPAPPPPPGRKAEAQAQPGMPSALQNAIKALGVKLKQVEAAPRPAPKGHAAPSAAPPAAAAAFVPNPADLLKLRAGLRRTENSSSDAVVKEEADSLDARAVAVPAAQPAAKSEQDDVHVLGENSVGLDQPMPQAAAGASAQAAAAEAWPDEGAAPAAHDEAPREAGSQLEAATAATRQQQGEAAAVIEGAGSIAADIENFGAAAATAATASAPTTAKKRVRFTMESATPEGAAKDATMTIHLRKGDKRQVVSIDADNTVAFSQWALGSVEEEEADEQLPATVTCKKSRRSSTLTAPSSAGKTPMHSALRSLFGENVSAVKLSPAPGSTMRGATPAGNRAPATTPIPGAKPTPARVPMVMDAATLAEKLLEIAKENDVTLELPVGTPIVPGSSAKEAFQVVVTPRSASKQNTTPRTAPVPRSVGNTASKSRLSQVGLVADGTPAVEPTEEVSFRTMALEAEDTPVIGGASVTRSGRRTPASRSAAAAPDALDLATAPLSAAEAGELPASAAPDSAPRSRTTPRVVIIERAATPSSSRGRLVAAALADAVAATATAATPRSASRTPRVVIIERAATPASVRSSRGAGQVLAGRFAAKASASAAEAQPALASPVQPMIVAHERDGEELAGEPVEQPMVEDQHAASHAKATGPQEPTVSLKQYQRVLVQAKAYRTQTVQLQAQLRRMTAKVVRLSKAASAVGQALEDERAKRSELQEAMQQIVLNREAAEAATTEAAAKDAAQVQQGVVASEQEHQTEVEATADEAAAVMELGGMACDQHMAGGADDVQMLEVDEHPIASMYAPKVVVVGPQTSNAEVGRNTERAGCVVVVRPPQAAHASRPDVAPEVPPLATVSKAATLTPGRVVVVASAIKAPALLATIPKAPAPTPGRVVVLASAVKAASEAPAIARKPSSSVAMPQVVVLPSPHKPAPAGAAEGAEVPAVSVQKSVHAAEPATTVKALGATAAATNASALKSTGKSAGKSAPRLVVDNVQLPAWLFPASGQEEGEQATACNNQADIAAVLAEAMEEVAAEAAVEGAAVEQASDAAGELEAAVGMEETAEVAELEAEPVAGDEENEDDEDLVLDASCHVCGLSEEGDVLLLCDGCDGACHLTCCNPPLKRVPRGDWFCVDCVVRREAAAAAAAEAARPAKKAHPAPQQAAKRASKKQAVAAAASGQEPGDAAPAEPTAAPHKPSGRGRRASVAPAPSQAAGVTAAGAAADAAEPLQQSAADSEGQPAHRGRPARGRRASVAPVSAPATVTAAFAEAEPASTATAHASSAEDAAKTNGRRGRRASVVPAAAAPNQAASTGEAQSEEPAAAAKPSRGRRASLAAVPSQVPPKRGRGGAALNAIVEEEEEQEEEEQPTTLKRQRAGATDEGDSERTTAVRTTRSRAAAPKDEEEQEASTRKGAKKQKAEAIPAAPARVTRSRR
ncbi:hypothetical protein N2152v2_006408 [Parachlorella kessleri]